jgi:hypothetical protein
MTFVKDVITLAYVSSGGSSIVYLEAIEKSGKYIYGRKQVLSGGSWIWDDYEYVLNTGEQPRAYYDPAVNKVYLSYKKDSISWVRMFDLSLSDTLEYLPNTVISGGYLYLYNYPTTGRNPENTIYVKSGSGLKAASSISDTVLFSLGATGLSFTETSPSVWTKYVYLPVVTGSNLAYLHYPYWIEFYTLSGSTYTLELSVLVSVNDTNIYPYRWYPWTLTNGRKYVGLKAYNNFFSTPFYTDPANYLTLDIFDVFDFSQVLSSTSLRDDVIEGRQIYKSGAGLRSTLTKTYEYDILRDFETDFLSMRSGSGVYSTLTKTYEYDILRDFESDSISLGSGSGLKCSLVIS